MTLPETHDPVSHAVVETVAETKDVDPIDLEPLYEVLDPDALDALFRPINGSPRRNGQITFEYSGCTVVVDNDDTVTLADEPLTAPGPNYPP